jgi:hypothetical protein
MAIDGANNLYIADRGNSLVRKIDMSGVITTVAGEGSNQYSGDGAAATSAFQSSRTGIFPLGQKYEDISSSVSGCTTGTC